MKKIILFFCLPYLAWAGYLEEVKEIDAAFFSPPAPVEAPAKKPKQDASNESITDLEKLYFQDSISTRASATQRKKKKKRAR